MKSNFSISEINEQFEDIKTQTRDLLKVTDKLESKIRELGVKYKKALRQSVMEMEKGASGLQEYHSKITTDENEIKKAAKKGKMFLNSVKALGGYLEQARSSLETLMPLFEDVEDPSWSYDELKKWLRNVSRTIEKIDKERAKADKTMGIDFMLKKRKLNKPLSQAIKQINQIKDFLQHDYMLIKYRDDASTLLEQLETDLSLVNKLYHDLTELLKEKSGIEGKIDSIIAQIKQLQSEGPMKELQDLKIELKKKELEIAGKFNPYKKIFGNLVSSTRRGDVSLSFELVGIARDYYDGPLEAFLKEDQEFTRILTLAEKLLNMRESHSRLKIRGKEINRLEGLLKMNKSKFQKLRDEYLQLKDKINQMLSNSKLKEVHDKISSLELEIEELKRELTRLTEEIGLVESKLDEAITAFNEKKARILELHEHIRIFQPTHVKV